MEQELRKAMLAWTKHKDYKRDAIAEVWHAHRVWCHANPGKTRYLSEIQLWINERYTIPQDLQRHLETEIYLANAQEDRLNKAIMDVKMAQEGFLPITWDISYRGQALMQATKSLDWMTVRLPTEGKFITDGRGGAFFIPKGRRTRGYSAMSLKGYYKPVN